jgi:3-phenylpropionate/trans-cinnamate dioxygenase ferredoxin reductase component
MNAGMVIVGAGMAGHRAVIGLRASGYEGSITLIGEEQHLPYDRPPLSKSSITEEAVPQPIWLMDAGIASSLKVDVKLNCKAMAVDRASKTVETSTGKIPYNKLLIATGAKPRKLTMPGGEHARLLRNFEDAIALRESFQPGKSIVIIGGGFIGLELASSATKRGCTVTLIEAQPRILMRGVPEAIAKIVHDRHVSAGVRMLTGTALKSLQANSVTLSDDSTIPADTIIAGIGAAPETTLAAQAGLILDNGIACNEFLQTSDESIFSAGDCCSFLHPHFGSMRIRLEAWRNAQDQGSLVAENMLGADKAYKAIPWFWSDQYDLSLQVAGMPSLGPVTVTRTPASDTLVLFHLSTEGQMKGVSAVGPGNSIARDVKLAEMLIARNASPAPDQLADSAVQLKSLLKG